MLQPINTTHHIVAFIVLNQLFAPSFRAAVDVMDFHLNFKLTYTNDTCTMRTTGAQKRNSFIYDGKTETGILN